MFSSYDIKRTGNGASVKCRDTGIEQKFPCNFSDDQIRFTLCLLNVQYGIGLRDGKIARSNEFCVLLGLHGSKHDDVPEIISIDTEF